MDSLHLTLLTQGGSRREEAGERDPPLPPSPASGPRQQLPLPHSLANPAKSLHMYTTHTHRAPLLVSLCVFGACYYILPPPSPEHTAVRVQERIRRVCERRVCEIFDAMRVALPLYLSIYLPLSLSLSLSGLTITHKPTSLYSLTKP